MVGRISGIYVCCTTRHVAQSVGTPIWERNTKKGLLLTNLLGNAPEKNIKQSNPPDQKTTQTSAFHTTPLSLQTLLPGHREKDSTIRGILLDLPDALRQLINALPSVVRMHVHLELSKAKAGRFLGKRGQWTKKTGFCLVLRALQILFRYSYVPAHILLYYSRVRICCTCGFMVNSLFTEHSKFQ